MHTAQPSPSGEKFRTTPPSPRTQDPGCPLELEDELLELALVPLELAPVLDDEGPVLLMAPLLDDEGPVLPVLLLDDAGPALLLEDAALEETELAVLLPLEDALAAVALPVDADELPLLSVPEEV